MAAHFEAGQSKNDWLQSNVIYGLLHQPVMHEAWKDRVAKKQHRFEGHQPMFSWSPETTGRAQGFVEGESPGRLQDLLEFFDGSKEMAESIARVAFTEAHVILRPKQPSEMGTPMPEVAQATLPAPTNKLHKQLHARYCYRFV